MLWEITQIQLAVLHCLNTRLAWIGEQPSAAIRRFFHHILPYRFTLSGQEMS